MERITRSQLELLRLGKPKKGFTINDVVAKLEAPRQSVYQRIDAAIAKGWLEYKMESSNGSRQQYRLFLLPKGRKIVETKWGGKGRFLVPQTKTNGKR